MRYSGPRGGLVDIEMLSAEDSKSLLNLFNSNEH